MEVTTTPQIGDIVKCSCGRVFKFEKKIGIDAQGETFKEGLWGNQRMSCPIRELEVVSRPLQTSSLATTSVELKNGVTYSDTVVVHEDGSRERTQWWAPGAYDEGEVEP